MHTYAASFLLICENDAIVIVFFCLFVSLLRFRSYSHAARRFYLLKRFPLYIKHKATKKPWWLCAKTIML